MKIGKSDNPYDKLAAERIRRVTRELQAFQEEILRRIPSDVANRREISDADRKVSLCLRYLGEISSLTQETEPEKGPGSSR